LAGPCNEWAAPSLFKKLSKNLPLLSAEGKLCHAAALLFAKNLPALLPGAQLKCARFAGTTSVEFIDESTFDGTVLSQLDNAQKFIARNIRQAIRIAGKLERDIIPEYPVDAVREALVNAMCHRDYATVGTIQVRIYDDRLEVWNPGKLPPDLTIAELYQAHASHPHNPRLAQIFYRARLIEQWGSGTLRMMRFCKKAGASVTFSVESGFFIVRFAPVMAIKTNKEKTIVKSRGKAGGKVGRKVGRKSSGF
jgi:ATP-dependent DNA helicase RecG